MQNFLQRILARLFPVKETTDYILAQQEPVMEPRNEIEELIGRWVSFDLTGIERVFSSDKSILMVTVRKKNIIAYRKYLEMIVDNFRNERPCVPLLTAIDPEIISLRSFFIDEGGYFTDPLQETKFFKELVIDFLTRFNEARKLEDRPFAFQKNISLTAPMVSELNNLLEVLQR